MSELLSESACKQSVVIINTGCANLSSVQFAVERLGVDVKVTDDISQIKNANKVLLPGVGAASAAMNSIQDKNLESVIQDLQQPVLGICLGMQLMAEKSAETPSHDKDENAYISCLNLIPTDIQKMQSDDLVLPHMGWNRVTTEQSSPLFEGIEEGSYFYFVHSFCAPISEFTLARSDYGQAFSASISKDNFYGVQFHPERSSVAGAKLLANFIKM